MTTLQRYILSVTAAAVVCAIVKSLIPGKETPAMVSKMLCGVFMVLTIITPLKSITIGKISDWTTDITYQADYAAAQGTSYTKEALAESIKLNTEAYILDKARNLQAELTVVVTLSEDDIPTPISVTLSGNVSPYTKGQLQRLLAEDLGIPEENQLWI